MRTIKSELQGKRDAVYIHSIKKKFKNKDEYENRRFKTSPEHNQFQITPNMARLFGKVEVGKHKQSVLLDPNIGYRLVQLKNRQSWERPKKRWDSIQKEQYNHIKNQIQIHKQSSTKPIPHPSFPIPFSSKIELLPNIKTPEPINPFYQVREKWFADRLKNHCKPKFFQQQNEREKDFSASSLESDSTTSNKPFNFSLKLPRLREKSPVKRQMLKTIQIEEQIEGEEQIFCNRKIKKSLKNLQSQKGADLGQLNKIGELALAVKRRRVKTIDYQRPPDTLIAPWNVGSITKQLFY